MADTDPYRYGDASDEDRLRFLKQQYAAAATAKRVSTSEKAVERQELRDLEAAIERLEAKISRKSRMHVVFTRRANSGC